MIYDTERREVARRLRELRGGWSSGECYYTIIHALGLPDTSREDGGHALYGALADLIEPDTTKDTTKSQTISLSPSPIDRDALLELADEMQRELDECSSDHEIAGNLENKIHRIREALKVTVEVK